LDPKKRRVGASKRDEFLRAAWRATVAGTTQAGRIVFVDECSTNVSLRPLYAWSPRGERAHCSPRNWGKNVTLLASMTLSGMGPSLAVEGRRLEAVMNSIRNSLGMRKTGDSGGSSQPENPHPNAVLTQVHNTL
jgi:hypothetical protein